MRGNQAWIFLKCSMGSFSFEADIEAACFTHQRLRRRLAQLSIQLVRSLRQFHQNIIRIANTCNPRFSPTTLLGVATITNYHLQTIETRTRRSISFWTVCKKSINSAKSSRCFQPDPV